MMEREVPETGVGLREHQCCTRAGIVATPTAMLYLGTPDAVRFPSIQPRSWRIHRLLVHVRLFPDAILVDDLHQHALEVDR